MWIRTRIVIAAAALMGSSSLVGCASTPVPKELASARRAYQEAQMSPAATVAPVELLTARQALDRAEVAFENEPDAQRTRDLAYVAMRRAQWAQAVGGIAYSQRQIVAAQHEFAATQASELARARQQNAATEQRLTEAEQKAQDERQARLQAEQRSREAVQRLANLAAIREDQQRGTVITLSGAVLFASGQSTLLPIARTRLDEVAEALKQQPPEVAIAVEGFTDARGSTKLNEQLSERRAQAVRDYLVTRGVNAARVRAVGRGPANPIADNTTAEGRANNRRVEIVIETATMGTPGTATPGTATPGNAKESTGQGTTGPGTQKTPIPPR